MTKLLACPHCGNTDIQRNASAIWDASIQQWVLGHLFDLIWCSSCGDNKIEPISVEPSAVAVAEPEVAGKILGEARFTGQDGSMPYDANPGEPGTCRLYMTMARNDDDGHTFTLLWARNPHTFSGLQKFVEEHLERFTADQEKTPPVLICANVDVIESDICEESTARIAGFEFRSIIPPVNAAVVN